MYKFNMPIGSENKSQISTVRARQHKSQHLLIYHLANWSMAIHVYVYGYVVNWQIKRKMQYQM